MNTFWAIVANAIVIGGAVSGGLLFWLWFTLPDRRQHAAAASRQRRIAA